MGNNIERFGKWLTHSALPIPEEMKLLKKIAQRVENGCVVMALESAFGVEATDEEWDMRVADIKQVVQDFYAFKETEVSPEQERQAWLLARAIDIKLIKGLFGRIAQHDTPLGRVLKDYDFSKVVLDVSEIRQAVREGKILLIDAVRNLGGHLFHAGITDDGRLISLSDEGEEIHLAIGSKSLVFIFSPRPPAKEI